MLKLMSRTFDRLRMRFSGKLADPEEKAKPVKRPAKRGRDRHKRSKR